MSNDAAAFADAIAKFTAALDGRHDSLRNCSTSERLLSEHLANDRYYVETRDGERHAKHDFVAEEENCSRRAVGAAQMSLHRATVAIGETAPPLVALLANADEIELARLVQSIGDAVRDGNPGHIDQTRQEANAALRVLAAKLRVATSEPAPVPTATSEPATPPKGTQPDPFDDLRAAAEGLVGKTRRVVLLLCEKGGRAPLVDVALACEWAKDRTTNVAAYVGAWNALRNRLNRKFKKHWRFRQHDLCAVAERLPMSARK